jgi:hypothetical protein
VFLHRNNSQNTGQVWQLDLSDVELNLLIKALDPKGSELPDRDEARLDSMYRILFGIRLKHWGRACRDRRDTAHESRDDPF